MLNEEDIETQKTETTSKVLQTRIGKMLSYEWLGQTIASICWIISVFVYATWGTGDWLQLMAASSWLLSNIASVISIGSS